MFCKNCGSQIDDSAVICPNCGVQNSQNSQNPQNFYAQPQAQSNTIAIVGFIFSFLIPLVGLICSIIGLNRAKDFVPPYGEPHKGLALAGIIISIASSVLEFFLIILCYLVLLPVLM